MRKIKALLLLAVPVLLLSCNDGTRRSDNNTNDDARENRENMDNDRGRDNLENRGTNQGADRDTINQDLR